MGLSHSPSLVLPGLTLCLDAGNSKSYGNKNFVISKIYSSYGASLRSSNYTVQYSDDNSNWTTAFTGVASNNTSCGIQQNTGFGSGYYGLHRYWRYVEGSPIQGHHPRVSRIILTDINGIDYNLVVYTSDNCSDTGTFQVGTVSLDFGGTIWTDLSGGGNTGTLVNGVGYNSSNLGSLVFDGSNQYVNLPYLLLSGSQDFTVNIWIKANSHVGGTIFANYPAGNLQLFYGTSYIGMWLDNISAYLDSPATEFTTNPVFFTAQRIGGNETRVYLNTVLKKTGASTSTIGNVSNFRMGTNTSTSEVYNGNISQISIYNRALTAAEISQNFNALRGRYGL